MRECVTCEAQLCAVARAGSGYMLLSTTSYSYNRVSLVGARIQKSTPGPRCQTLPVSRCLCQCIQEWFWPACQNDPGQNCPIHIASHHCTVGSRGTSWLASSGFGVVWRGSRRLQVRSAGLGCSCTATEGDDGERDRG
eukprot:1406298-Rhodomonas_salina.1